MYIIIIFYIFIAFTFYVNRLKLKFKIILDDWKVSGEMKAHGFIKFLRCKKIEESLSNLTLQNIWWSLCKTVPLKLSSASFYAYISRVQRCISSLLCMKKVINRACTHDRLPYRISIVLRRSTLIDLHVRPSNVSSITDCSVVARCARHGSANRPNPSSWILHGSFRRPRGS